MEWPAHLPLVRGGGVSHTFSASHHAFFETILVHRMGLRRAGLDPYPTTLL